jgi:DNA-binding transcriptional ArsR family regulator
VPVDRSQLNAVGDIVVTDPRALRALADPTRLRLFELVQRRGPIDVDELRREIGGDEEATRGHLAELEASGLIEAAGSDWSTPARGLYFEIPEHGEEEQQAARTLSNVMVGIAAALPQRWVDDAEPRLSVDWARSAGVFNARVDLTQDELRELQAELERVLEPFTTRDAPPPDAASVRVLAFFMPDAS